MTENVAGKIYEIEVVKVRINQWAACTGLILKIRDGLHEMGKYQGADKSLARPGMEQTTATKL